MLDFCKKPGFRYPLEVILIEQRLLKSRKLLFQEYQDTLYPVLNYVFKKQVIKKKKTVRRPGYQVSSWTKKVQ